MACFSFKSLTTLYVPAVVGAMAIYGNISPLNPLQNRDETLILPIRNVKGCITNSGSCDGDKQISSVIIARVCRYKMS